MFNWFKSDKIAAKTGETVPASYIKKTTAQISDTSTNYTNTELTTLRNQGSSQTKHQASSAQVLL